MPENNYGYIAVNVRTANGALPVEKAIVTIKDADGELLAVFFTDRNGNTPKLKVLAPPLENSESPGQNGPPYYSYNIDTDKEGYISVRNIGAPVYPGITSIQPVELIPLSEGSSGFPNDNMNFTENIPPNL